MWCVDDVLRGPFVLMYCVVLQCGIVHYSYRVDILCWCMVLMYGFDILCVILCWYTVCNITLLLIPCGHIVLMYGADVFCWYTVWHLVLIHSVKYYITNSVWTYCVDVWCVWTFCVDIQREILHCSYRVDVLCWCIVLMYCVTSCVDVQCDILHD